METSDLELLRQTPLFAGLEESALRALAGRCRHRRFRANESLFHQGDPGQSLYVIISGRLRVEVTGPGDQIIHLARRWRIEARVSQKQMAEELATTRESVNRAFSRLKQVQAVGAEGRDLIVLNPRKLRQYAGDESLRSALAPY